MRHLCAVVFTAFIVALLIGCEPNRLSLTVDQPTGPTIPRRDGTPMPDERLAAVEHDVLNQTLATINFMELRTRGEYVTAEKYDRLAAPLYDLLEQAREGDGEGERGWSIDLDPGEEGELFTAQRMILLHGISQILYLHQRYRGRLPTDEEIAALIEPFLEIER